RRPRPVHERVRRPLVAVGARLLARAPARDNRDLRLRARARRGRRRLALVVGGRDGCGCLGEPVRPVGARRARPRARRPRRDAAAPAGAAPIVVLVGTADNGQLDWIPPPTVRRVAVQTWDWAGRNPFALVAACAGLASLVALRPRALRWQAVLAGAWLAAPFAVTLVLSAFQPAFDAHYLSAGSPGLALGVAAALVLLPRRLALPLGALVAAGAVLQLVHFYLAPGKPLSSLF